MMKKLKVAWLHSHFLYWMGGTKFIYEVIKRLSVNFDITVYVERASPVVLAKYDQINIPVKVISDRSSNDPFYWLFFPYYLKKEMAYFKKELTKYDVLVSSMFPMNWIARCFNKPKLQYCYEPFAFFHDQTFINNLPLLKKYLTTMLSYIYKGLDIESTRKQDIILTLSDVTQQQISKVYGKNSIITHEGVDTNFFRPKTLKDISEKYKGWKMLIHSTDFSPIKGTKHVVNALPLVLKKFPKTKLLITSTINDQRGIRNLTTQMNRLNLDKNIEYLGFVDFELLPVYYSTSDVLIHAGVGTSGATTMSLPVKEALACETPVVRSNDTKDEVQDKISGYLVNPTNKKELADAIIKILANQSRAVKMGKYGRVYIKKNFTWEGVAAKILNAIQVAWKRK